MTTIANGFGSPYCQDIGNLEFIISICSDIDSNRLVEYHKIEPNSISEAKELLDKLYEVSIQEQYEEPDQIEILPYKFDFNKTIHKSQHGLIQKTEDVNYIKYVYDELSLNEYFFIEFQIEGEDLKFKDVKNQIDYIINQME